jgi:hypothetical protein
MLELVEPRPAIAALGQFFIPTAKPGLRFSLVISLFLAPYGMVQGE